MTGTDPEEDDGEGPTVVDAVLPHEEPIGQMGLDPVLGDPPGHHETDDAGDHPADPAEEEDGGAGPHERRRDDQGDAGQVEGLGGDEGEDVDDRTERAALGQERLDPVAVAQEPDETELDGDDHRQDHREHEARTGQPGGDPAIRVGPGHRGAPSTNPVSPVG
ncbi:MAG: hypothetical protein AAGK32_19345, partial [Actinomycetota bacterium]